MRGRWGSVEVGLAEEVGRQECYSRLVKRRHVGSYLVQLADDAKPRDEEQAS